MGYKNQPWRTTDNVFILFCKTDTIIILFIFVMEQRDGAYIKTDQ